MINRWIQKGIEIWQSLPKKKILKGIFILILGFLVGILLHYPMGTQFRLFLSQFLYRYPLSVETGSIRSFPFLLKIKNFHLYGAVPVTLDTVSIYPSLRWKEGPRGGVVLSFQTGGGKGRFFLAPGEKSYLEGEIEKFPLWESGLGNLPHDGYIKGFLNGRFSLWQTPGYPPNLSGDVDLAGENTFLYPGTNLPIQIAPLSCEEIRLHIKFQSSQALLEPGEMTCEDLKVTVRGTIQLRQSLQLSHLNLRYLVEPGEKYLPLFQTVAPLLGLVKMGGKGFQGEFQGPLIRLLGRSS